MSTVASPIKYKIKIIQNKILFKKVGKQTILNYFDFGCPEY